MNYLGFSEIFTLNFRYGNDLDFMEMIRNRFSRRVTYSKQQRIMTNLFEEIQKFDKETVIDTSNPLFGGLVNMINLYLGRDVDMESETFEVIDEDEDYEIGHKMVHFEQDFTETEYKAFLYYCFLFSLFHKNIKVAKFCLEPLLPNISELIAKNENWLNYAFKNGYDQKFFVNIQPFFISEALDISNLQKEYFKYIPKLLRIGYHVNMLTMFNVDVDYLEDIISSENFLLFDWRVNVTRSNMNISEEEKLEYDRLIEKYRKLYQNYARQNEITKQVKMFRLLMDEHDQIESHLEWKNNLVNRSLWNTEERTKYLLYKASLEFYDKYGFEIEEIIQAR